MPSSTHPLRDRTRRIRLSPRRGAALLAVVMALVLAGLLLTPLARSTAFALHQFSRAAGRDRAVALQASALATLRSDPCSGAASGDTAAGAAQLSWSANPGADGTRELSAIATLPGGDLDARGSDVCR